MSCYVCNFDSKGCERCEGGPGEQGLSHDEQEVLELRDRVRELERELGALLGELYGDGDLNDAPTLRAAVVRAHLVLNGVSL